MWNLKFLIAINAGFPPLVCIVLPQSLADTKDEVCGRGKTHFGESDILALFPEALAANIEAVLPDQTGFVRADAASTCMR